MGYRFETLADSTGHFPRGTNVQVVAMGGDTCTSSTNFLRTVQQVHDQLDYYSGYEVVVVVSEVFDTEAGTVDAHVTDLIDRVGVTR